jgi:hypothetical protein
MHWIGLLGLGIVVLLAFAVFDAISEDTTP